MSEALTSSLVRAPCAARAGAARRCRAHAVARRAEGTCCARGVRAARGKRRPRIGWRPNERDRQALRPRSPRRLRPSAAAREGADRRLREPVRAAHRAARPRAAVLRRDRVRVRDARAGARGEGRHPLGRPRERVRARAPRRSTPRSSARASPCSASATACSSWRTSWAARCSAPTSASSAAPASTSRRPTGSSARSDRRLEVWMSHGDSVVEPGQGFEPVASSPNTPFAAVRHAKEPLYGVQFHPEVTHTPQGGQILGNFLFDVCGLKGDWTMSVLRRGGDRDDPRPGGADGRRHLRPLRRRRLVRRRRADPPRDRRPADVHLRRQRPAAARRGRRGAQDVRRALPHAARVRRRGRALPRPRSPASTDPEEKRTPHRPHVHRGVRARGEVACRAPSASRRARSTRT